jgi:hypothetical protein
MTLCEEAQVVVDAVCFWLHKEGRIPVRASSLEAYTALGAYAAAFPRKRASLRYYAFGVLGKVRFFWDWWAWQLKTGPIVRLPNCRVYTTYGLMYLSVMVLPSEVEGLVSLEERSVIVYVVEGTGQYEWAASRQEAMLLASQRKVQ